MSEETEKKHPFQDGVELTLKGTPKMAMAAIGKVANELKFQSKRYAFDPDPKCSTETFIEGDLTVSPVTKEGWRAGPIAIIELYLLPENKTLFRIPPSKYWGIFPNDLSNFDPDGSLLKKFVKILFNEFARLGFVDFKKEKPAIGFRLPYKEGDV